MANTNLVTVSGEEIVVDESSIAGPVGIAYVLGQSAVGVSVGNVTTEAVLATVTIPAGIMGRNGRLIIHSNWTMTNGANDKTMRIRLGGVSGTAFLQSLQTTQATYSDVRWIANRNSFASQVGTVLAVSPLAVSTSALITGTIDTSAETTLVFTGQKESGSDTLTLESYCVQLLYGA